MMTLLSMMGVNEQPVDFFCLFSQLSLRKCLLACILVHPEMIVFGADLCFTADVYLFS